MHITEQAASHLQRIRTEKGHDDSKAARLVRNAGRVGLTFTAEPEHGDEVVGFEGIRVFIAPDVATTFEQSTIDAQTEDGKTFLVLRTEKKSADTREN